MEIKHPDVKVKLVGEDGNVFSIMGRVGKALKRAGYPESAKAYYDEVMKAKDYDDALGITMTYVEVGIMNAQIKEIICSLIITAIVASGMAVIIWDATTK